MPPEPNEQIRIIKNSLLVVVSVVYVHVCSMHAYFGSNIVPNMHAFLTCACTPPKQQPVHYF